MDTYTYELIADQPSKNTKFLNTGKVCEMYEIKKPSGIVCYDITPIGGYVAMDQREGKICIRIHINKNLGDEVICDYHISDAKDIYYLSGYSDIKVVDTIYICTKGPKTGITAKLLI